MDHPPDLIFEKMKPDSDDMPGRNLFKLVAGIINRLSAYIIDLIVAVTVLVMVDTVLVMVVTGLLTFFPLLKTALPAKSFDK